MSATHPGGRARALGAVLRWVATGRVPAALEAQMLERQREFIDDATHELLTPLTIMRGHLELCGDDPAERDVAVQVVRDEVVRMTRLVDDLRVLADTGQPDFLDLEELEAGALVREVFDKVRRLAPRDWRLADEGGGWVAGDRQRLQQALINLAHNAAHYTREGDRIEIGACAGEGTVRLWVADSGPGIPEHEHERIFERFTSGAGGLRHPESRGLGLAIVSAIARAHGGHVDLDSAPGDGSTFAVVIPELAHKGETCDESHPDSGGRAAPVGLPRQGPSRQRIHDHDRRGRRYGVAHGA